MEPSGTRVSVHCRTAKPLRRASSLWNINVAEAIDSADTITLLPVNYIVKVAKPINLLKIVFSVVKTQSQYGKVALTSEGGPYVPRYSNFLLLAIGGLVGDALFSDRRAFEVRGNLFGDADKGWRVRI